MPDSKAGRPSVYSNEVADTICERLIEGESIRSICRDDDMPGLRTVFGWLEDDRSDKPWSGFPQRYARARQVQAEVQALEIVGIADTVHDSDDSVKVARDKLRVDARKWVAARLVSPVYGQKTTTDMNLRTPEGIEVRTVRVPEKAQDVNEWAKRFRGATAEVGASTNGTNGDGGG